MEPAPGQYAWAMIDRALATAASRGQALVLRVSPYEGDEMDVPDCARRVGAERSLANSKWRTDPENPLYVESFGGLVRSLGRRYDGHRGPRGSANVSIVGYWGEGSGGHLVTDRTRKALLNAYCSRGSADPAPAAAPQRRRAGPRLPGRGLPIAASWPDGRTDGRAARGAPRGLALRLPGGLGGWKDRVRDWAHVFDVYPPARRPERGVRRRRGAEGRCPWRSAGFCLRLAPTSRATAEERYVLEQALKWHVSSVQRRGSPVPPSGSRSSTTGSGSSGLPPGPAQGRPLPRRGSCPTGCSRSRPGGRTRASTLLRGLRPSRCASWESRTLVRLTNARIPSWLPGVGLYDGRVFLPRDVPEGAYELQLGMVGTTRVPRVRLAIEGRTRTAGTGWARSPSEEGPYPVAAERVLAEHRRTKALAPKLPLSNFPWKSVVFHDEAIMSTQSQISATVSSATKEELDRFTESHGLKKNYVVEQALLFFMAARRDLPDGP